MTVMEMLMLYRAQQIYTIRFKSEMVHNVNKDRAQSLCTVGSFGHAALKQDILL